MDNTQKSMNFTQPMEQLFSRAPNLKTDQIKFTADSLNRPPFMMSLSLVEYDDKAPMELLEIINQVFKSLDETKYTQNMSQESQTSIQERIVGFLKILGYPSDFNVSYQQAIGNGDKKTCQHIVYWLLSNSEQLKRVAHVSRFLLPLEIPQDFQMDANISEIYQVYKDLQAEFKAVHQSTEEMRKDSMKPNELKKEISQLEQEKEQLVQKINHHKSKTKSQSQFAEVLDATSKLRKMQEQDAQLVQREMALNEEIDSNESKLLQAKQELLNVQKASESNIDSTAMLQQLRDQVRNNRTINNEVIGHELQNKRQNLQRMELLLQEPQTTQTELERLTNDVRSLQSITQDLQIKLDAQKPADGDRLAIYRQQANAISKKIEQRAEDKHKLEVEKQALEKTLASNESQFKTKHGTSYMKKDDFKQYAANLRVKNNEYKSTKKELEEMKQETQILKNTFKILGSRAENLDEFMSELEQKKGIKGYGSVEQQIQKASEQKEHMDNLKGKSLQEITGLIVQIQDEINSKKSILAPQIKELRQKKANFINMEEEYLRQKRVYESQIQDQEMVLSHSKKNLDGIYKEYTSTETKYHQSNIQNDITTALLKRVRNEDLYKKDPMARLSQESKTNEEYLNLKLQQQTQILKDLRAHQNHIKNNSVNFARQKELYQNLRYLLEVKKITCMRMTQYLQGYQDTKAQGYDRFVVRDDI